MQLSLFIVFIGLTMEIVEFGETYKIVRPYKFYNRNPWRSSWWHSPLKTSKRYRSRRIPSQDYQSHEPSYHRYAPRYKDSMDASDNDKPYVIVIQLPEKKEKSRSNYCQRHYAKESPTFVRDDDYIDDDYDDKLKVYQLDNKRVKLKLDDQRLVLI